jgi:hypothetical protein
MITNISYIINEIKNVKKIGIPSLFRCVSIVVFISCVSESFLQFSV